MLRKKAAEELKKEQERKAAERRRIIEERCGKPKNVDDASEGILHTFSKKHSHFFLSFFFFFFSSSPLSHRNTRDYYLDSPARRQTAKQQTRSGSKIEQHPRRPSQVYRKISIFFSLFLSLSLSHSLSLTSTDTARSKHIRLAVTDVAFVRNFFPLVLVHAVCVFRHISLPPFFSARARRTHFDARRISRIHALPHPPGEILPLVVDRNT